MIDQIIEKVTDEDYQSLLKKINDKIKDYNDADFKLTKIDYFGMSEKDDRYCSAFMLFEQMVSDETVFS